MIDLLHETKPQNAWIPLYVRTEVLVHIYQKALERNNFKVSVMKKKNKKKKEKTLLFLVIGVLGPDCGSFRQTRVWTSSLIGHSSIV